MPLVLLNISATTVVCLVLFSRLFVRSHDDLTLVDNSLAVVLPSDDAAATETTGLAQLVALIKRSDTVAVKSEGTRVIVNLIKSLWSSEPTAEQRSAEETQTRQQKRERAIQALVTTSSVDALAALIGRSAKHPILINEAVVALSLLSTHRDGGRYIGLMYIFICAYSC